MFDFLIRKGVVNSAQGVIDRLSPKVNIHIPKDLPIPSISVVKRMAAVVSKINSLESQISNLSEADFKRKTQEFQQKIKDALRAPQAEYQKIKTLYNNASSDEQAESLSEQLTRTKKDIKNAKQKVLESIMPEAFAMVREASRRTIGLRHFDIQLVGGMVLHEGKITEMATGEGKTLVATSAAYLNGLTQEGVHIVTVNDYLANRDREWMGPIYEYLGLAVGVIQHDMDHTARQQAYACDIAYGTNNEFGFDYLRDNMVGYKEEMVQRAHHFAIVDEVDSILIDEARTPLIISGPAEESTDKYYRANEIAKQLKGRRITEREEIDAKYKGEDLYKGLDYIADEKARSVSLSEDGEVKVAKLFGVASLHDMETIEYRHHILQALRAKEFFSRDVDYVVRDGKVIIVDEFTGRMMPGRRWSDGLHQAVESKEGIKIERENQTLATITLQNYFRMFEKLAGMTGTAYTEANEFKQIYELDCVVMPPNRILSRTNHPDCIYKTTQEKYKAVVDEIVEMHKAGRPVLVGTISIEKSELLSSMLKKLGITHQVLNAKYHELEAHIVAQAGRHKAVTIATNMAGRGTDIMLGGNAEHLAKSLMEQKSKDVKDAKDAKDSVEAESQYKKFLEQFKEQVKKEHELVVQIGGLHVLGTERHESRRIDNQLRGRSGRQGDPGSSRFYVSLQDDLMRLFGSDRIMVIMDKLGMEEGQVIEHPLVSRALETAQKRVENHNFEIRKQLIEYDNVMNRQREVIYNLRRSILEGENIKEKILNAIAGLVDNVIQQYLTAQNPEGGRDLEGLEVYLKSKFNLSLAIHKETWDAITPEKAHETILNTLYKIYEEKEKTIGADVLRRLERIVLLQTIDSKWKDHLYAMDQLKEGIGLRSFAQRDPLIEYKREGFVMFEQMYATINQEVAEMIFRIEIAKEQSEKKVKSVFGSLPQQLVHQDFASLSEQVAHIQQQGGPIQEEKPQERAPASQPIQKTGPKVGRNDPCPCGSGKKYKKCCGA